MYLVYSRTVGYLKHDLGMESGYFSQKALGARGRERKSKMAMDHYQNRKRQAPRRYAAKPCLSRGKNRELAAAVGSWMGQHRVQLGLLHASSIGQH